MSLALYFSRVRCSELLGVSPPTDSRQTNHQRTTHDRKDHECILTPTNGAITGNELRKGRRDLEAYGAAVAKPRRVSSSGCENAIAGSSAEIKAMARRFMPLNRYSMNPSDQHIKEGDIDDSTSSLESQMRVR